MTRIFNRDVQGKRALQAIESAVAGSKRGKKANCTFRYDTEAAIKETHYHCVFFLLRAWF